MYVLMNQRGNYIASSLSGATTSERSQAAVFTSYAAAHIASRMFGAGWRVVEV